jgi:hypothetical protein
LFLLQVTFFYQEARYYIFFWYDALILLQVTFFYQYIIFSFDMMLWFYSLEVSIFVFIFFATNSYFAPFYNHSEVIGSFHYFLSHSEDLWLMKSNLPWKCKTTSVIWYLKQTKWKRFYCLQRIYMDFYWNRLFSQSKSPLDLSQFSSLWRLWRMQRWFLSKTDLKGI